MPVYNYIVMLATHPTFFEEDTNFATLRIGRTNIHGFVVQHHGSNHIAERLHLSMY